jgi:hypothetical protein
MDLIEEISKRHLNLPKIFELEEKDQKIVFQLFDKLNKSFNGNTGTHIPGVTLLHAGVRFDYINGKLIYDTLVEYDFLVTRREENLNKILDEDKKL